MKFLLRLLSCVLFVSFIACGEKTETSETDNLFKFKEYITQHTYGNKSITTDIRIALAKPLEQFEITQEIPSEYLKISPKTKGKLIVENSNTLLFQPDTYLNPNTEYTITVLLHKLYENIDEAFSNYTFSFKTFTPNFSVTLDNLQSYNKQWQYVNGAIEASDIMRLKDAKALVSATQGNKKLNIEWPSESNEARYYNFKIDSISRKINDDEIVISWNGKTIGAENKGSNTLAIPGQNNFKVVDLKANHAPQASLMINFSDPIQPQQDFAGLVTIENASDLRFEADGNVLTVYPNTRIAGDVRVTIFNGIKNTDNFGLKKDFSELISFEQLKPAVRLLSKGVILPNAQNTPLYFETVNLKAVDVRIIQIYEDNMLQFLQTSNLDAANGYDMKRVGRRVAKKTIALENALGEDGTWKAHAVNISEFFKTNPGSLYQVEFSFTKDYIDYECTTDASTDSEAQYYDDFQVNSDLDEDSTEEKYWDNELYRWRRFSYNWQERDNPCHPAYYNQDRIIATNILGSDLGIIAKKGKNKSYRFATTNLLTTNPESSVKIDLYNYQQQRIETITTDKDGFALFDSDRTISFAVARKGKNYAYSKLDDGNALSMSKFDVSGKELQKGLKGFIYTERGVHRPGDSIHLTFVLNDVANPLPKNHPVRLEVTDARGKMVQRTVLNGTSTTSSNGRQSTRLLGSFNNGFYYFPIKTEATAPTGNWNATISAGGVRFSKTLKVATIKPNRLKIQLEFDTETLDASKPVTGNIKGLWLHGAPARNLKVEMDATLRSTTTAFRNYKDYQFNDPVRRFDEVEIPITSKNLSTEGMTSFSKKFDVSNKAPGMLQATFLTKIFEGGGDFSIDVFSKNLAPYSHFVGLQSPEPHRYGSYYTDQATNFDVVSVDTEGNPIGNRKLEIKVFKIEWRWWWNRGRDNLSRYEDATIYKPYKEMTINTAANGKGDFNLNIPEAEGGRYLIRVIDPVSGHATGRVTYFYRNWWKRPTGEDAESAKMLVFSANKEQYNVGEEAVITFPSSSKGRALISVENGTEVLTTQWIETKKGETQAKIKLSKDMAPNVYINISLLQPHEQTKNDLPMRLYGVIPILVEDPSTMLKPMLEMPETLKPETNFTLKISEANNKPMTYTVAMVDEGLLDLTRFATPPIHDAFYTREALGVKTFDMYDYVIGAYSGSVNNIYEIGGGDAAAGAKNRKADRFKPVVRYLGPFTLKKGETATHTVTMPNYIGAVRTMVIAGDNSKSAYGKTDKTTPVKKPLMVLASVPRVLSPGEKVTIPVTVFAMEPKIKSARVRLKVGDALKPLNGTSKTVSFPSVGEQIVNFEFEVLPTDVFQTIEVAVSGNGENASYKLEVDVENPNPVSQKTTQYELSENGTETISFETFGVAGTNAATLEFSTLPPMDFSKRMEYLIRYPHGCVEQTTSAAFPQLYLADVFDITFNKKKEIENNVAAAIKKLGRYQIPNGGMAYWPGERDADNWSTNYVGHFMLEAKNKGYALPLTFMSNWLRYQQLAARQWRNSSTRYNSSLSQAYRLYTLALAGHPELAAMNRLRESNTLSNDAKWRLAAAYALAGKKNVAEEISANANINFKSNTYDYYTYGSPFRNKAMALETMVITGNPNQREMAISVAKELASARWFSTQETSYGLLAMAKMVQKNGGKALELNYIQNGKTTTVKTDRAVAQRDLDIAMGTNTIQISNKKGNMVYVNVLQKGKLPLGKELAARKNLSLQAQYLDGEGKKLDVTNLRQGTEINAVVAITNTSNDAVSNMALTKIFPGGWEIMNTSFTDLGGGTSGAARYKDIRDDRVNFYFDLPAKKTKTFTVKLNASYLGTYYLPGTQVEAMYDNNYHARNQGSWVTVTQ